jgi:hypothetical protein
MSLEAGDISPGINDIKSSQKHIQQSVEIVEKTNHFSILFLLNISTNLNSIIGACVFILASSISLAMPSLMTVPQILFLIGSMCFVLSAASSLALEVQSTMKIIAIKKNDENAQTQPKNLKNILWNDTQLSVPTQMFLFGSILYVVGSILFFYTSFAAILASEIVWAIGSVMFFYGGVHSLVKQQVCSAFPSRSKSFTSITQTSNGRAMSGFLAADLFSASGLMFCVGSASYLVNTVPFTVHGNIAWIIGSVFTISGAAVSLGYDIREKHSSKAIELSCT